MICSVGAHDPALHQLPFHAHSLVRRLRAALLTREFRVRPSQVTGKVGASAAGLK